MRQLWNMTRVIKLSWFTVKECGFNADEKYLGHRVMFEWQEAHTERAFHGVVMARKPGIVLEIIAQRLP